MASSNLLASDFFATNTDRMRSVDAIVGNPPFIRYQRFSGEMRRRALARAAEQGLKLSGLSSSWLPFLVHSIRFVRPGGRIAMVIPFEIGHASYAVPVLRHLDRMFESVTFLTFRKKLFPDLSQDTILLLAEGKDGTRAATSRFEMFRTRAFSQTFRSRTVARWAAFGTWIGNVSPAATSASLSTSCLDRPESSTPNCGCPPNHISW